jgi:hypothetical protein
MDRILEVQERFGGWIAEVDVPGLKRVLFNILGRFLSDYITDSINHYALHDDRECLKVYCRWFCQTNDEGVTSAKKAGEERFSNHWLYGRRYRLVSKNQTDFSRDKINSHFSGMDEEFLKEKLFLPFKQANAFSPGMVSIALVW